jgi:hypothetical protein
MTSMSDEEWIEEFAIFETTTQKLMGVPTTLYATKAYALNALDFHNTRKQEMQHEAEVEERAEREFERLKRAGRKAGNHPGTDRRKYYDVVKDHNYVIKLRRVTEWADA